MTATLDSISETFAEILGFALKSYACQQAKHITELTDQCARPNGRNPGALTRTRRYRDALMAEVQELTLLRRDIRITPQNLEHLVRITGHAADAEMFSADEYIQRGQEAEGQRAYDYCAERMAHHKQQEIDLTEVHFLLSDIEEENTPRKD